MAEIPFLSADNDTHGQRLVQRDAGLFDLNDQVAADFADDGNGLAHDKASSARCWRTSSLPVIFWMVTVSPALDMVKGIPHTPLLANLQHISAH